MAGLVPAIHVLLVAQQTWMAGTSPGMTAPQLLNHFEKCSRYRCWVLDHRIAVSLTIGFSPTNVCTQQHVVDGLQPAVRVAVGPDRAHISV
jgi:hypothetical protein